MLTVTTSWDDGDVLDLKLAALLDKYNIKGTFYISKDYRKERLSDEDIKAISQKHEMGAHTLTHPDLPAISLEKKKEEIDGSKKWLEELLGKEVPMFCYPRGLFDEESKQVVREAGFVGARTVQGGQIIMPSDKYEIPTTMHVYPLPFRKLDAHSYWWGNLFEPLQQRGKALRKLGVSFTALRSFEVAASAAFDIAQKKGGVFHLWGHSWEIEKYGMWDELERVLSYISKREHCNYVVNKDIPYAI